MKSIADHFEHFKDFLIDAQEEFVKPEGDSAPADALLTNNVFGREDYPLERKVCGKVYPKAFHDASHPQLFAIKSILLSKLQILISSITNEFDSARSEKCPRFVNRL